MYEINTKFKSQVRHNFATFILRKSVSILGFWISASSILMVLVILLENVFKLSIYLDIYISVCVGILPAQSVEASLLRTLNSYFKIDSWPHASLAAALTLSKMFNSIFKAFSDMLKVSKSFIGIVITFWVWNKTKRGLPSSTYSTWGIHIWAALFSSLKIII